MKSANRFHRALLGLAAWLAGITIAWSQSANVTVLYDFKGTPDGQFPVSLVVGADGALYGVTGAGGTTNSSPGGTVFKIFPGGSGYATLHSFNQTESGNFSISLFPAQPIASISPAGDGFLYGTLPNGGTSSNGAIFKMDLGGASYTIIHNFGATDSTPETVMQGTDGVLYGTGFESIYRLNTDGSGYTLLTNLNASSQGEHLNAALFQAGDGFLYGTAYEAGPTNEGTIFKISTNGSGFTVIHSFSGPDGTLPHGGLIQGLDGALYGVATGGGSSSAGTLFKINTDGSGFTNLWNFSGGLDGGIPIGGLAQGPDGLLYGTASHNGANGFGTLFAISPQGNAPLQVLFSFAASTNLSLPCTRLLFASGTGGQGVVYGAGAAGGPAFDGALFAAVINPLLTITPVSAPDTNGNLAVLWPSWALGYVLQSTTNLSSSNWTTVTNGTALTGMQVSNSPPNTFYRLVLP